MTTTTTTGPGWVYVLSHPSWGHKIGLTRDWPRRAAALEVGSTTALVFKQVVPDPEATEQALHRQYRSHRVPQTEWFPELSDQQVTAICQTITAAANPEPVQHWGIEQHRAIHAGRAKSNTAQRLTARAQRLPYQPRPVQPRPAPQPNPLWLRLVFWAVWAPFLALAMAMALVTWPVSIPAGLTVLWLVRSRTTT
jgi:hypothetical protein